MKPVYQTIFEPPRGDCWRACIATLLERSIDEVPNFAEWYLEDEGEAWQKYLGWLAERGWFIAYFPGNGIHDAPYSMALPGDTPIMVTVQSPRGPWNHCVIMTADMTKVLWDPFPNAPGERAEMPQSTRLRPVDVTQARGIEIIVPVRGRVLKPNHTLRNVEIHLANTGPCDSPSCLLWGHLATMLRQDGLAKGEPFDEHFKGTSLE